MRVCFTSFINLLKYADNNSVVNSLWDISWYFVIYCALVLLATIVINIVGGGNNTNLGKQQIWTDSNNILPNSICMIFGWYLYDNICMIFGCYLYDNICLSYYYVEFKPQAAWQMKTLDDEVFKTNMSRYI